MPIKPFLSAKRLGEDREPYESEMLAKAVEVHRNLGV